MEYHELTPKSEIETRINKLQKTLKEADIDGAVITQFIDLFYFTGTSQSGHLIVPAEGKPLLMVRKSFARAQKESSIENIVQMKSIKELPGAAYSDGPKKKLGFELDVLPFNTYAFYKKLFAESEITDLSAIIKKIRAVKSPYEIEMMKKSAAVLDSVFRDVPSMYSKGMTEIELASRFEQALRSRGYGGGARMRAFNQDFFYGNVNTGHSGSVPTYFDGPVGGPGLSPASNPGGAGWKPITKDEMVYIDYTCVISGYTTDCARMFATGKLTDRLVEAHKISLEIQEATTSMMKPGTNCMDIYEKSVEIAEKYSLGNNYMGIGPDRVKFLGHGVGLELDEFPIFAKGLDLIMEPGMTFAMEPKFVFEEGAIGTENTFVMTENGPEVLTVTTEEITYL